MSLLQVTFEDKFDKEHVINFFVDTDIDLPRRWFDILKENLSDESKNIHTHFSNATLDNLPEIQYRINSVLQSLKQGYNLPESIGVEPITQSTLNNLHEQYEKYGGRVDEIHDKFLELNELIHTCEDLFVGANSKDIPIMHCTMNFYPQTQFSPILEKDKLFLKTDFRWGGLYLGYNTLGKDWLNVCIDNDIEVMDRNMVKPQERFSAETWFHFGTDDVNCYNMSTFSKWWHSLSDKLKEQVPIDNLNQLCLGRFLVGGVIIDQYFLLFDSNKDNWLIPNSKTKKKWNQEVFSTFRKITKIKLVEDNA